MFSPEDIIARCALQNPTRNFGFGSLDAYVARKRETKAKYSKRDGRFCSALGRAAAAYKQNDPNPGVLTVGDLIRVAGELKDPKIALSVGKAAAGCGVLP